jgi:hypothetical protein
MGRGRTSRNRGRAKRRLTSKTAFHIFAGSHLLESGTLDSIRRDKRRSQALIQLYGAISSALHAYRSPIAQQLQIALRQSSRQVQFDSWKRCVSYKSSGRPLSAVGSRTATLGGRFNTGMVDPSQFPPFPALYLGSDAPTALTESVGSADESGELTRLELALQSLRSLQWYQLVGRSVNASISLNESHCRNSLGFTVDSAWRQNLSNGLIGLD